MKKSLLLFFLFAFLGCQTKAQELEFRKMDTMGVHRKGYEKYLSKNGISYQKYDFIKLGVPYEDTEDKSAINGLAFNFITEEGYRLANVYKNRYAKINKIYLDQDKKEALFDLIVYREKETEEITIKVEKAIEYGEMSKYTLPYFSNPHKQAGKKIGTYIRSDSGSIFIDNQKKTEPLKPANFYEEQNVSDHLILAGRNYNGVIITQAATAVGVLLLALAPAYPLAIVAGIAGNTASLIMLISGNNHLIKAGKKMKEKQNTR